MSLLRLNTLLWLNTLLGRNNIGRSSLNLIRLCILHLHHDLCLPIGNHTLILHGMRHLPGCLNVLCIGSANGLGLTGLHKSLGWGHLDVSLRRGLIGITVGRAIGIIGIMVHLLLNILLVDRSTLLIVLLLYL